MRILGFSIIVLAIVAGLVAVIFATGSSGNGLPAADALDISRIETLEHDIARARQEIEGLQDAVEALREEAAAAAEHTGPHAAPGRAAPAETAEVVQASAADEKRENVVSSGPEGEIRQLIRDEMKKMEEERIAEMKKRNESWKADQWEIDEFRELASTIHRTGVILDLTDKQKRLYHPIIKEYGERIRSLWKELQDSNPGAEMGELQKIYKEESDQLFKETREQVESILTPEQRKKYREECKKTKWFK